MVSWYCLRLQICSLRLDFDMDMAHLSILTDRARVMMNEYYTVLVILGLEPIRQESSTCTGMGQTAS